MASAIGPSTVCLGFSWGSVNPPARVGVSVVASKTPRFRVPRLRLLKKASRRLQLPGFIGIAKRKADLPVGRKWEVQPDWPPVGARGGRPGLRHAGHGVQGLGHCGQAGIFFCLPVAGGKQKPRGRLAAAGAALRRTRKLRGGGPSRPASGPTLKSPPCMVPVAPRAGRSQISFALHKPAAASRRHVRSRG